MVKEDNPIERLANGLIQLMSQNGYNVNLTLAFNNPNVHASNMERIAKCFVRRLEKKVFGQHTVKRIQNSERIIGIFFPEKMSSNPHLESQLRLPEHYLEEIELLNLERAAEGIFSKLYPRGTLKFRLHEPPANGRGYCIKERYHPDFFSRYFIV